MVSNQHRYQDRIADSRFVEQAIQHLRALGQRACGGWSAASEDGRHRILSGQQEPETIIETHGLYAETLVPYLLAMDPHRTLNLLALLENLQSGISTGSVDGSTRRALVAYAETILGRKRKPIYRRPAS